MRKIILPEIIATVFSSGMFAEMTQVANAANTTRSIST